MTHIIPYGRQSINEEDIEAVCSALRSDWLTQGPRIREFEEALSMRCGAKYCIAVSNGTTALHLACLALDIAPEEAGLTSPISFLASANCIAYSGGRADFADIDPQTLCISPKEVEEYCKTQGAPKVVIPVDFAGVPADLPRLKALSETYGFKIIEDAAHAIGSLYKHGNKKYLCGSCAHTDMAILSFHPVKTITSGEGGAILTNDGDIAEKLRRLANHGIEKGAEKFVNRDIAFNLQNQTTNGSPEVNQWYYEMHSLGFNARITDIQCALGLSQLKRLEEFKKKRQDIVRRYNEAFAELEQEKKVVLPPWPEETDPCFHLYPIRLGPKCLVGRDKLYSLLREKGIYCQVHYIPIYRQPFYRSRYHYSPDRFPEAENYFKSCLSLPLFPGLDEKTFHYIVRSIRHLVG